MDYACHPATAGSGTAALTMRAGLPATTVLGGTSLVTLPSSRVSIFPGVCYGARSGRNEENKRKWDYDGSYSC